MTSFHDNKNVSRGVWGHATVKYHVHVVKTTVCPVQAGFSWESKGKRHIQNNLCLTIMFFHCSLTCLQAFCIATLRNRIKWFFKSICLVN